MPGLGRGDPAEMADGIQHRPVKIVVAVSAGGSIDVSGGTFTDNGTTLGTGSGGAIAAAGLVLFVAH